MTAIEKIIKYLSKRKTPATAKEVAKGAKVNYNTVRRELGSVGQSWDSFEKYNIRGIVRYSFEPSLAT